MKTDSTTHLNNEPVYLADCIYFVVARVMPDGLSNMSDWVVGLVTYDAITHRRTPRSKNDHTLLELLRPVQHQAVNHNKLSDIISASEIVRQKGETNGSSAMRTCISV